MVRQLAAELATIPSSELAATKLVVNQASTIWGSLRRNCLGCDDSMMRNTPEALRFIDKAKRQGVNAAIAERDGPFYQYSRARRLVLPHRGVARRPQQRAQDVPHSAVLLCEPYLSHWWHHAVRMSGACAGIDGSGVVTRSDERARSRDFDPSSKDQPSKC